MSWDSIVNLLHCEVWKFEGLAILGDVLLGRFLLDR